MSSVVGVDLSSKALDLVKLDETSNRAEWVRVTLDGKDAWERTLGVRDGVRQAMGEHGHGPFWDDVYLVAIEAPYGRGQAGTNAILNRVVGAVAASLPARLRVPERCWIVRPDEWKAGLGLKAKPTADDVRRLAAGDRPPVYFDQNSRDAYCLAMFARDLNRRGTEEAA